MARVREKRRTLRRSTALQEVGVVAHGERHVSWHGQQQQQQHGNPGGVWPRAARLQAAGRLFMTPSDGAAGPSASRGMDLDLSQLTLAEKEAILRVIKRDEALRRMEERRILL